MRQNNKVLLGMSGGTDSSVAALLLQDAGYDVTGITFRFYEKDGDTEYLDDARSLCRSLGMRHVVCDAREEFRSRIISYFIREYMSGHTPVPCTLCNNHLKWPLLEKTADELRIYHLATGHYVQKAWVDGYWHIVSGSDADKDQSFFLWGLPQRVLARMLLPMGTLAKTSVRELAAARGFQKVARKRDSLGVCFCPMDYRSFLKSQVPEGTITPGDFCDEAGNLLGKHEGFPFYTVGQRRGLGLYLNKALFVKEIIPQENRVVISDNLRSLERREMFLTGWHVPNPNALFGVKEGIVVKIRYRKQSNRCTVVPTEDGRLHVLLHEPLAAIAAGQAAVFYRGDVVLGGGIIL